MNRPTLIPGLPRTWRGAREIQLGADPATAVSIDLLDPRAAQILDLLDGTRSERAVLIRAAELGVPTDQARALLDTLQTAGLVLPASELLPTGLPHEARRRLIGEAAALAMAGRHPADILRRRSTCRVVVTGHGRLGASIAVALAEAGVGEVQADLPGTVGPAELPGGPLRGADLGRPRREAISDAISRAVPSLRPLPVRHTPAPRSRSRPGREDPVAPPAPCTHDAATVPSVHDSADTPPAATLVVQLDHSGVPGVPHLAVTIRDGTPVIGPFVTGTGGPCLRCLELHRRDRDARWPGPPRRGSLEAVQPCSVATLLAATAFATAEALAHLDGGRPQTVGAAVEITGPGRIRRRRWAAHPGCPCTSGSQ